MINHALAKASRVCVVGVCGRAVALQLAQSYHVSGVRLQVWRRWFQACFASAFFVSRAAVHYWINQSFAKALGVCAARRAAAFQLVVRNHTKGMGALASLAVAVSIMFYVGVFLVACCRALLDKLGLHQASCVCAVAQLLSTLSCAVPPRACRARVTLAKKIPTAFCVGGSCGAWCRVL